MRNFGGLLGGAVALSVATGLMAPSAAVATGTTYDIDSASSLTVVVNKHRPLDPPSYVPKPLSRIQAERMRSDAAEAYKKMVRAAKADGVNIVTVSGYRSYDTQASLYGSYVQQYGQETADIIAARPGHSEHQTGLAMDVGNASGACALQDCFEDTPVGAWVAAHAWKYGFIIRYPKGEEGVTGYTYEPWHIRYVGPKLAEEMRLAARKSAEAQTQPDIDTMEEFFGLEPAPDYLP
ncbi:M15 family metallopeptidase [Kocuria oceani]|uniref:M15 family metallopeptidase n=1 Tax=Kocuria oceani TaxID=988827 RepID=A0ABV9TPB8_9MICC|nr:M15 family metallopeptidase [Kocuria oceani]